MKKKKLELTLTILLALLLANIQAQESTTASGGDASGIGGSVNYSIGQVFYTTNTGSNGNTTQGVQQAYEISVVTAIDDSDSKIFLSVFPNPTIDLLTLQTKQLNIENLVYQIFDINGKLLDSKSLTSNETKIVMTDYSTATYFLKVTQGNKLIKTFKIIKN
jgi:hypothetical protein